MKDSTAGLGTITFYDDNMTFGALGHGICEGDTPATLFPLEEGLVYSARVYSVEKGVVGLQENLGDCFLMTLFSEDFLPMLERRFGSINSIPQKQSLKVANLTKLKRVRLQSFQPSTKKA